MSIDEIKSKIKRFGDCTDEDYERFINWCIKIDKELGLENVKYFDNGVGCYFGEAGFQINNNLDLTIKQ